MCDSQMRSRNLLDSLPADKRLVLKGQCTCRCTYYEQAAIRLYPSKEHEHGLAVCFVRGRYASGGSRVFRRPPLHVSTRIVCNSLYLKLSGKVQVTTSAPHHIPRTFSGCSTQPLVYCISIRAIVCDCGPQSNGKASHLVQNGEKHQGARGPHQDLWM